MAQEKKKYTVAGWEKTIKGNQLLSITIDMADGTKKKFSLWKNNQKKSDKHPDWSGYEDTFQANNSGQTNSSRSSSIQPQDDDLPF